MPSQEVNDSKVMGILLRLLSYSSSVAGLVAFAMVFIDKIAAQRGVEPQFAIWQVTLAVLAVLFIAASGTLTVAVLHGTITRPLPLWQKILGSAVAGALGIVLIAVFVDGAYAALRWQPWCVARVWRAAGTQTEGPRGVITDLSGLRDDVQPIQAESKEIPGQLSASDQQVAGYYVDVWSISGDCGGLSSMCIAEVRSTDFQPTVVMPRVYMVQVPLIDPLSPIGNNFVSFVEYDDSAHYSKAKFKPFPKDMKIVVTSARVGGTGQYTLRLARGL